MEWYSKTLELYEIIKAIPNPVIHRLKNLTSGVGTVLTYKIDDDQSIITFDYSWDHKSTTISISASGVVQGTGAVMGGVTGPPWGQSIPMVSHVHAPMASPVKRVRLVTSLDLKHLLTLQWNDMAVNGSSQYVYSANSQGHYSLDDGQIIISAMPLTNGRSLVNGVLYDPETSPAAFMNDIENGGVSILEVIKILGQYNNV